MIFVYIYIYYGRNKNQFARVDIRNKYVANADRSGCEERANSKLMNVVKCMFADVCWRMLTYADVRAGQQQIYERREMYVCWRMLTYADVCWRMLTYADVRAGQQQIDERREIYVCSCNSENPVLLCLCLHVSTDDLTEWKNRPDELSDLTEFIIWYMQAQA